MGLFKWLFGDRFKIKARLLSREEARTILLRNAPGARIEMRDGKLPFACISVGDFESLMRKYREHDPDYRSEIFDCDDSGDTFMGDLKRGWAQEWDGDNALCFGWIKLRFKDSETIHWMNWMIDADGRFNLVEPQWDGLRQGPIDRIFLVGQ